MTPRETARLTNSIETRRQEAAADPAGQRKIIHIDPEHSGDPDQPFQAIPITHSDRSRSVWRGVREGAVGCIC
jgi:hypothetical protein